MSHLTPPPYKDQYYGAFIFSLLSAWTNCWIIRGVTADLRRLSTHVTPMGCWVELNFVKAVLLTPRGFVMLKLTKSINPEPSVWWTRSNVCHYHKLGLLVDSKSQLSAHQWPIIQDNWILSVTEYMTPFVLLNRAHHTHWHIHMYVLLQKC